VIGHAFNNAVEKIRFKREWQKRRLTNNSVNYKTYVIASHDMLCDPRNCVKEPWKPRQETIDIIIKEITSDPHKTYHN